MSADWLGQACISPRVMGSWLLIRTCHRGGRGRVGTLESRALPDAQALASSGGSATDISSVQARQHMQLNRADGQAVEFCDSLPDKNIACRTLLP